MKMKHTPGPWEYGEERGCCREIHADNGPELYAIAQARHGDPEICEANARLIAAAPELLDELIEQDKFLGVLAGTVPLSEKDTHRRIAMHRESVRAAIAKATSRE